MALMGRFIIIVLAMLTTMGIKTFRQNLGTLPKPVLDPHFYWGPGKAPVGISTQVRPFTIDYGSEVIEEMRDKLSDKALSKLRDPLEGTTFNYGMNTKYLKKVLKYWRDDYLPKWVDTHQVYLNKYPQFKTKIQGLDIHFIHIKSKVTAPKHYPLLLLHGWPGSIVEFYDFIEKVTNQEQASFDIVVASLPGYGFSDGASKVGLSAVDISVIMRNLMLRLGYPKFLVQGGDWGSFVGASLAVLYPENVLGFHSNMCATMSPMSIIKTTIASFYPKAFIPEEYVDFIFPALPKLADTLEETGYFHLQATKPDTIGAALTNNPIGLAAYILEKFAYWTDHSYRDLADGGLTKQFTLDQLLHNLMIYYLSNSIQTSQRLYAETMSARGMAYQLDRVPTNVPIGCARFKHDLGHSIDWALQERFPNLIHSTYHKHGGHFAAFQLPDVLVKDFMSFVRKLE